MKWFEKSEIKNQETLTQEQIKYLQSPSLAIWGFFNGFTRGHWDYLLTSFFFIVTNVLCEFLDISPTIKMVAASFQLIILFLHYYFFSKHSRRLAWNRKTWKNFDSFVKSETVWSYLACFCLTLQLLLAICVFIADFFVGTLLFVMTVFPIAIPFVMHRRKERKASNQQQIIAIAEPVIS